MWPTPSAPSAPLRAPPRTAAPRGAPCPHEAPRRRGEPSLRRWAPAVALAAGRHALRPIRRVALVGGTHGNELSGVYLVRSLMEHPLTHYDSLSLECLIGNPRAVDVCQRFVDTDLNRCFSKSALQSGASAAYEPRRAQEIDATLGPRFSEEACDLCIDLHNTTSNFGCGIIITNTSSPNLHWKLQLCCHLQSLRPDVHVVFDCVGDCAEEPFLPLLAKNDLTFEVGPQAHGTLLAEVFWKQKRLVLDTLDWLERYNRGELTEEERSPKELEVHVFSGLAHYPLRSDGSLSATIAPELQGRDFQLLRPGDLAFQDLETGERIAWDGPECYPVFINEAAYLASHVAFQRTQRHRILVPEMTPGSLSSIELPAA